MTRRRGFSKHSAQGALIPQAQLPKPEKESGLQSRIIEAIRGLGILCWRQNVGKFKLGKRWVSFGEAGMPDLFCVVWGRIIGIEIKRPGEEPREHQDAWARRFKMAGGKYVVAHSVDEAVIPVLEVLRDGRSA
jgi:hypothetical protein